MRKNSDRIELTETITSEGVPHFETYALFGVFKPEFSEKNCKTAGNCKSVDVVLQRSYNDAVIE